MHSMTDLHRFPHTVLPQRVLVAEAMPNEPSAHFPATRFNQSFAPGTPLHTMWALSM